MAKITIVGAGPGSPDFVTPAARRVVQEAQVVVGAERSLNLFRGDINGETLTLTAKNVDSSIKYAADSAQNGKTVAILSTGDPGFSGLLGSVQKRPIPKGVELVVIPGVSALQACAAKLCISWDSVALFAFHEEANPQKKRDLTAAVKAGKTVLLLPEPKAFPPSEIAAYLLKEGVDKATGVVVCENLTLPNERIVEAPLEEAAKQKFPYLCVMAIKSN
jgi:cobalt-precorrin-7 (C5)-methyltransferase